MIATTITHGPLSIDFRTDGNVVLSRTDLAQSVMLSKSEWLYILRIAEVHDWPIAAPAARQEGG